MRCGRSYTKEGFRYDKIYRNACRMCHGSCGVLLMVKDGRVVRIKGDPESPYDPAMGTYQLRALLCRIKKAEGDPTGVRGLPK